MCMVIELTFQHPAAAVDRRGLLRNQTGSLQRRRLLLTLCFVSFFLFYEIDSAV